MLQAIETATRIRLKYEDHKTFTYSKIINTASNENIYKLAMAFNSIQTDTASEIKLIKEYSLFNM